MSEISEAKIAELLKLCDDREKPLIVGYGMAVVFTEDIRALLASHRALAAEREEAERLREALTKDSLNWQCVMDGLKRIGQGDGDRGEALTAWAKAQYERLRAALQGEQPHE